MNCGQSTGTADRFIGRGAEEGALARQRGQDGLGPPRIPKDHLGHAAGQRLAGSQHFLLHPALRHRLGRVQLRGRDVAHQAGLVRERGQQAGHVAEDDQRRRAQRGRQQGRGAIAVHVQPLALGAQRQRRHHRRVALAHQQAQQPAVGGFELPGEIVADDALAAVLHRAHRGLAASHQQPAVHPRQADRVAPQALQIGDQPFVHLAGRGRHKQLDHLRVGVAADVPGRRGQVAHRRPRARGQRIRRGRGAMHQDHGPPLGHQSSHVGAYRLSVHARRAAEFDDDWIHDASFNAWYGRLEQW